VSVLGLGAGCKQVFFLIPPLPHSQNEFCKIAGQTYIVALATLEVEENLFDDFLQ
jgi:hypothetical protein